MRILVVHDDAGALEKFRRFLLERQSTWNVRLERNTTAGLEAFHSWSADAVVAAIRPPAVDGVELLMNVRDEHAETVRIAVGDPELSDASLRSLKIAHRVVPENINALDFVETLRRSLLLRDLVSPAELRALLGEVGQLPGLPGIYAELSRRLEDPSVSVLELAELVSEDVALAAQVLRMSNSAYFGRERSVTRLSDAAARLGTRLLRSLVLTAELYGGFPMPRQFAGRHEELQRHAALVARIASSLEPRAAWKDDAFSAGLLHDVGKLVLMSRLPVRYEGVEREAAETGRELTDVEMQRLGANHGTVGACLLGMWGLPSVVLEAVNGHHGLALEVPHRLNPSRAVALADRLAHDVTDSEEQREQRAVLPVALLTDPRWTWWREMAEQMAMEGSAV
ncbi:MAG TPA: response regulator [Candidatus Acidoferrales bacterium]|nr:response regulator [Candidatus Acidoferrales bacterium]